MSVHAPNSKAMELLGLVSERVKGGGTSDDENRFAMQVAGLLGIPLTGGSDAHSTHGLGKFVTAFRDEINSEDEFLKALHDATFYPAVGLREGNLRPYTG